MVTLTRHNVIRTYIAYLVWYAVAVVVLFHYCSYLC